MFKRMREDGAGELKQEVRLSEQGDGYRTCKLRFQRTLVRGGTKSTLGPSPGTCLQLGRPDPDSSP